MSLHSGRIEQLILETLRRHRTMTMENLAIAIPQVSWNCLFHAVDALSRGGAIAVHRCGFDYELSFPTGLARSSPPAA